MQHYGQDLSLRFGGPPHWQTKIFMSQLKQWTLMAKRRQARGSHMTVIGSTPWRHIGTAFASMAAAATTRNTS
jgi:hypothetical protein